MLTPIVATKLYLPPLRPILVSRPHLIERLSGGLHRKLTLISAPAGFGKTTLVSEWIALIKLPTAWLALGEEESDPHRFLMYLVAALQTIMPAVGERVLHELQSPQLSPPEAVLAPLLNELATIKVPFVLVLDDYHTINEKLVDQILLYLLTHQPPQMHLIIVTREDPRLPLGRLRAQDQLTELQASHLGFTPSEAATFLTQVMGLTLSVHDIARLSERTEGWIAGLQLAALAMQGHQDVPAFIRMFAGDHRFIVDYLVEEVLQRQPEPVRNFLLQTAILERLNGSLCDAVTGQQEGNERLELLERGNFFVVPLDNRHHWYRYHHLFAEVLATHLQAEQPDQVPVLHQRASVWYEQHGFATSAIQHAFASEDFERAANMIELAVPEIRRSRQETLLLGWLKMLPDHLIRFRPVLSVGYAWALLAAGELESVHARLQDAERWLDAPVDAGEMVVVDKEEFYRLPGAIAIYRAAHAQALGNVSAAITYAQRVLDHFPEKDSLEHGAAVALLGLAFWVNGDLEAAHQTFADGLVSVQMAGNISDAINGTIALADIKMTQGRLREAMYAYKQKVQEQNESTLRGMADLYVGMSELYREYDDLDTATQYLLKSKEQGEYAGLPQNRHRWFIAMARIEVAQSNLDGALDLLNEAERLYRRDFFPDVRPIAALKARVWIARGQLGEALGWVRRQGLAVSDELSYLREFEYITLARVLLARYKDDHTTLLEVMGLLERLLQAARAGGRTGSVIEILVLQALTHQMQGHSSPALLPLQQALALAEPEGYVRVFVDEGPPMARLLEASMKHEIASNYVYQLLTAMGFVSDKTPVKQVLIEALSERELDVLRLLRTDLNGPEMARELIVSLNTIRTHTKSIYSKLGVNNRRAAVRRAEELDLF